MNCSFSPVSFVLGFLNRVERDNNSRKDIISTVPKYDTSRLGHLQDSFVRNEYASDFTFFTTKRYKNCKQYHCVFILDLIVN